MEGNPTGEADIHFDLYRHLQNAIESTPDRGAVTYGTARPEYSQDVSGRADIVVFDANDDPVFVVEAKRPDGSGSRDIDPYAPAVIRQAFRYAGDLGAPYFCTYNRDRLVVFDAFEEGVPLLERSTKHYAVGNVEAFADTLLTEIARLVAGERQWDTLDTVFIDRVNSLHEFISPRLGESLTDHLASEDEFRESFIEWTGAQGIEYAEAGEDERVTICREFAEQGAYLLINKIIFYKILENAPTYAGDVDHLAVSPYRVQEDLEDYFQHLVDAVDFEAIYDHDEIYSEIPLDPVAEKIREFIIELDEQDLTQFDSDVVGRIYEGVIPPEQRRAMGEYYTPPAITELITRLTVQDQNDRVLDPACGSGGFLVSAYHRIRDLLPEPDGNHERILSQLSGVEINRFPAHLTAINLAIQDLSSYTHEVNIEIADFFDVLRYQRFARERASVGGGETEEDMAEQIGGFDAVVANPPYIRQENIEEKDHVRDHLDSQEIDAEYISRRSDIYAYFITHGTEFLAEGGDLGFITSDRWLDTKYGEDLQQFVLDNYEIRAIITFDRQVFDDALVDSSVLILRRQSDEDARDDHVAKFIRLKEEMDIGDIASVVEGEEEPNQMFSTEEYRLVTRKQSALYHEKKWNVFFFAPPIYFDLEAHPDVVRLSDIADVSRGITTGANAFFFGHTEEMEDLGLTPYLSPLLKATGQVDTIKITDEDVAEWSALDIHNLVEIALESDNGNLGQSDADIAKEYLSENGHNVLLEYIRSGEDSGYHERSTLEGRDVWFDLGDLPRPHILSTMFTWRVHRVFWNEPEAATSDQFYYITPEEGIDELVLCGILNSRMVALANELKGRRAGGQGMTRLQTKVYETEQWPVPNPHDITDSQRESIRSAFDELMKREEELDDPSLSATEAERDALDRAIIDLLEIDGDVEAIIEELKRGIEAMLDMREEGAGFRTTVLVERDRRIDAETGTIELPGVASTRDGPTLSDF